MEKIKTALEELENVRRELQDSVDGIYGSGYPEVTNTALRAVPLKK